MYLSSPERIFPKFPKTFNAHKCDWKEDSLHNVIGRRCIRQFVDEYFVHRKVHYRKSGGDLAIPGLLLAGYAASG